MSTANHLHEDAMVPSPPSVSSRETCWAVRNVAHHNEGAIPLLPTAQVENVALRAQWPFNWSLAQLYFHCWLGLLSSSNREVWNYRPFPRRWDKGIFRPEGMPGTMGQAIGWYTFSEVLLHVTPLPSTPLFIPGQDPGESSRSEGVWECSRKMFPRCLGKNVPFACDLKDSASTSFSSRCSGVLLLDILLSYHLVVSRSGGRIPLGGGGRQVGEIMAGDLGSGHHLSPGSA